MHIIRTYVVTLHRNTMTQYYTDTSETCRKCTKKTHVGSGRLVVDTRILTRSLDTRTGRFPLSTLLWKRPITAAVADAPPAAIRGQAPENQDLRLSPVLVYDLWSGTGDVYIIYMYICTYNITVPIYESYRYTNLNNQPSCSNYYVRTYCSSYSWHRHLLAMSFLQVPQWYANGECQHN